MDGFPQPSDIDATNGNDRDGVARKARYIPALDGIRALAVIAVVLYHLGAPWMSGGLLGVTMFFVISGYIITKLLLREFSASGTIDLKSFWIRRARRLLPAIGALIIGVVILCAAFNRVMLTKMRPEIIPSLLFFNNWWQIAHDSSYFAALGDPSPLTHFWSLAIEEQFYLLWPILLLILLRLRIKRSSIRRIVIAAAALSALAMAILYHPGTDPSRVYYGTDTRMFSLLLGAWLAFIPERSMGSRMLCTFLGIAPNGSKPQPLADPEPNRTKRPLDGAMTLVGCIGLAGLVLMFSLTNGYSAFPYRGGMLLCSLLTLMLIAACVQPNGPFVRFFSAKPIIWIGQRSYSIYLWHFPLLSLMNPVADISADPWWATLIQLGVVLAVAEASYKFIETPFRKGLVGKIVSRLREGEGLKTMARRHILPVATCTLLIACSLACLALVPDTSALSKEGAELLESGQDAQDVGGGSEPGQQADFPKGSFDILMIGDSVSLRTVPAFEETFPHGHIDAMKNRQFGAGIDILDGYLERDQVGRVVVIALGTNGLVTPENIDAVMGLIGPDRIGAFVTTRSPQPWVDPTNDAMREATRRFDNARLIDWYTYSENRNDLFDGDGTHLSAEGAREYIELIKQAVKSELPVHPEDHVDRQVIEGASDLLQNAAQSLSRALTPTGRIATE